MDLLTKLEGVEQNFSFLDLEGLHLAGAKLHRAQLKGAFLNNSIFEDAELHGANLTEAQCIGTDFTGAHLTGACLEAWNIDDTTVLTDIDCQYVFLKAEPDARGDRERRPHNPDKIFQPGDFEKFFKEMLDTVQILIRNGVDPVAFKAAFEQVMVTDPDITRESVQAMEKQGEDVLLTLKVPEGNDKAQVERSWDDGYQRGLKAGYTSGLLEGQTQRADDVKEVALGFGQLLSSIQITNMNNPINTGDGGFINTGSMEGNVVNLGELSGQVSVQINQLPDMAASADQPNLKDLLLQLKAAVDDDTELSADEKVEALGEVAKLAKAGTNPQENAMQRMAKRATDALKSIAEPLSEASKLATVCKSLLPMILTLF
ncbi:MAG: pentapeptide repeat-containing protein [Leptolyngbyaceae cyanobacterium]